MRIVFRTIEVVDSHVSLNVNSPKEPLNLFLLSYDCID